MMDKRTRVFRTMDKLEVDRPPFSFWQHCKPEDFFGEDKIAAHKRFYEQVNPDFIKMMIDGYRDPTGGAVVKQPQDWAKIVLPKEGDGFVTQQQELIRGLIQAIHGDAPVFYHIFSPFSVMRMVWGHDIVFSHLRDDNARPYFLEALHKITDCFVMLVQKYLEQTGAAGVMITLSGAEPGQLTDEEHVRYVRPSDLAVLEAANRVSNYNILHLCGWGERPNRIERWRDYPAAVISAEIEMDQIPLDGWNELFPNVRALIGGFEATPQGLLSKGIQEEIVKHALDCVQKSSGSPYIVGAGNSFPPDWNAERAAWVGKAIQAY